MVGGNVNVIAGKLCIRKAAICERAIFIVAAVCARKLPEIITAHMARLEHGFTAFGKLCEKGVTIQMIAVITFMVAGVLLCVKNGRNMNHLNFGL